MEFTVNGSMDSVCCDSTPWSRCKQCLGVDGTSISHPAALDTKGDLLHIPRTSPEPGLAFQALLGLAEHGALESGSWHLRNVLPGVMMALKIHFDRTALAGYKQARGIVTAV